MAVYSGRDCSLCESLGAVCVYSLYLLPTRCSKVD